MNKLILAPFAAMCVLAACNEADEAHDGASSPAAGATAMQAPLVADDSPDFLPKDMSWMPADIWLPDDFEPRQSQKISPVADTYVLRGITQMSSAALAEAISTKMTAANYEPYEPWKPKPGRLMFRGNGHGTIVITIGEATTGRELVISVENASGQ
ncbi:MAG: hypothetical protein WBH10_07755 [Allopontixanthobacter sediminis]